MIELKAVLEVLDRNTIALNALTEAINNMGGATPAPAPTVEVVGATAPPVVPEAPAPPPPVSGLPAKPELPQFATDKAKRDWLINFLTARNIEIPPRTKTTTLEGKWLEIASSEGGSATPPATPEPAPVTTGVPPVPDQDALVDPLTGQALNPNLTKEGVTAALRAYIDAAPTPADAEVRRNAIRSKLAELGAASVSELGEQFYPAIMAAFGAGG